MRYKIQKYMGQVSSIVDDKWSIPLNAANSDYQRFKKDIEEDKGELQDADGNVMTAEEAKAYIATLP